ncbi:MAG: RNA-binding cell elongation regulator Jag/EloR [Acidimicrobiia bacterium]
METTGRTVAEALDSALDELGVDEDEVEYEVMEEPRGGLLGRREARIRARVKPVSREKPGERRRRSSRRDQGRGEARRPRRPSTAPAAVATDDGDAARPATRRRRRGGRGRGGARSGDQAREQRPAGARGEETMDEEVDEVSLEEQRASAEEFTRGIVDAFEVGAATEARIEDDGVLVDVTGDDVGLLLGPKGATLQAIEELVRTAVQRQTEGRGARINVDVGGYRAKRREALGKFARELAEQVLASGEDQALEPMNASDRKVVHDAVAELDGLATASEGEDPRRWVVIHRV